MGHVHLCVKNTSIVSFWWLPLARIAYFAGFVHEMSRGAAHAFLYGFTVLVTAFLIQSGEFSEGSYIGCYGYSVSALRRNSAPVRP